MWDIIAGIGLNVIGGYGNAKSQQETAKAQYTLDKTRSENNALLTASNNMLEMTKASYASYEMQRQNNQKLKAYGEAVSQEAWNSAKTFDSMNRSKFETSITNANNLGAISAAASAAGVGGGSVDMVAQTEATRQARQEEQTDRQFADTEYARNLRQVSLMDNALNSLEVSAGNFADLTYKAMDVVTDNSALYKYNIGTAARDAFNGYKGNISNYGIDVQKLKDEGTSLFNKATGLLNSGLGGATRL